MDIDSKVIVTVKDFSVESIPLYYTREVDGGRLINCSECGKLVLIDNKAPGKYCKKCAKVSMYKSQKQYMERKREE